MVPNEQTAAICGLFCGTCPSYPADCHGCLSDLLTPDCAVCGNGFRDCAKRHEVTRCYECAEFPCVRLRDFSEKHYYNGVGHHENVIPDLECMRGIGVQEWVSRQTAEHTCDRCGKLIHWYNQKHCGCPQNEKEKERS